MASSSDYRTVEVAAEDEESETEESDDDCDEWDVAQEEMEDDDKFEATVEGRVKRRMR